MKMSQEIKVQTLDHLGIIAGIVDEIGIVEQLNKLLDKIREKKSEELF
jgi:hypothetical protein